MPTSGQHPTKFVDELRPDFIGLPYELLCNLANVIYQSTGDKLITPVNEHSSDAEKFRYVAALNAFANCSLFKLVNAKITQDFRAYSVSDNCIEISSLHRRKVNVEYLEVRPIANQRDMEQRWLAVKMCIDQVDLKKLTQTFWVKEEERNKEIVFKAYGIFGVSETPISEIAVNYDLSRARVYQILNAFERNVRSRIHRTIRIEARKQQGSVTRSGINKSKIASKPVISSDEHLVVWLMRLGNILIESRISLANALDYISEKYADEYKSLKKLVPCLRSTESFFEFLATIESRSFPPKEEVLELERPLICDTELLGRLSDVDIAALPLPIKTINTLKASEIFSAGQLAQLTLEQMYQIPNLNRKSIESVLDFFKLYES